MFVLQDSLETTRRHKPVYFCGMTGIGPKYTENKEDAEIFSSKQDALQSPAYANPMCFFEPVEIQHPVSEPLGLAQP